MWYPIAITVGILLAAFLLIYVFRLILAWGIGRLTRLYIQSKVDITQAFHDGRAEETPKE